MPTPLYCWRCGTVIPMLDEDEWAQLAEPLGGLVGEIQRVRQEKGASIGEATKLAGAEALRRYFELTGHEETNVNALWHHRRLLFGPPCHACGKPLRTPEARHCAECGAWREQLNRASRLRAVP